MQKNDNASFLPKSTESTRVLNEFLTFTGQESLPTIVVFERAGGLTDADKQAIAGYDAERSKDVAPRRRGRGRRSVVLRGRHRRAGRRAGGVLGRRGDPDGRRRHPRRGHDPPDGLTALVGGQGGILGDFITAFGAIDGILLVVALLVVLVILVVVYRTIILPLVVMLSAVLALGVASAAIYALAKNDVLDLNGQSQGILFILALGRRHRLLAAAGLPVPRGAARRGVGVRRDAARLPCGRSSRSSPRGVTVILGLLCLLLSDLSSLRGLGPVGAIGIAGAMLSALTLLPAALLLLGRGAFWPFRPMYGSEHREDARGLWGAGGPARRPAGPHGLGGDLPRCWPRARRSCRRSTRTRCRRPTPS